MIYVCNVKDNKSTHYVGRNSSYKKSYGANYSFLGNPFVLTKEADRKEVIEKYEIYFNNDLLKMYKESIEELKELSKTEDIYLGCFCSPKSCHAEIIKKYLERE